MAVPWPDLSVLMAVLDRPVEARRRLCGWMAPPWPRASDWPRLMGIQNRGGLQHSPPSHLLRLWGNGTVVLQLELLPALCVSVCLSALTVKDCGTPPTISKNTTILES